MANHPQFKAWQDKIKLMRAQNATADAPAAIKKDVEDQLKLLETAVNKFNTCYDSFPRQWQQLQEQEDVTRHARDLLKERFEDTQGDVAQRYLTAVETVDKPIIALENQIKKWRGEPAAPAGAAAQVAADPPESIPQAEQALNTLKQQLAAGPDLKQVETLCDEVGKWGADAAKARKDAEGISPAERPIEAAAAFGTLERAYSDLVERLKVNPIDGAADKLAARFQKLPALLSDYRAAGRKLEELKNKLKAAEAELEEKRKSRLESILLEFENPTPKDDNGDGGNNGGAGGDNGGAGDNDGGAGGANGGAGGNNGGDYDDAGGQDPDKAPVGPTSESTPHMRGESRMWGDIEGGES